MNSDGKKVEQTMLRQFGIRVDKEMGEYVARLLDASSISTAGAADGIAVLGGDSRTGIPRRIVLPADEIRRAMQAGLPA